MKILMFRLVAVIYVTITLPFLLFFLFNVEFRRDSLGLIAHYQSKLFRPEFVFIGDSNVRNGADWSYRIFGLPGRCVGLGVAGVKSEHAIVQMESAIKYCPKNVVILVGTNDVNSRFFSKSEFKENFRRVIELALENEIQPIATLIPYRRSRKYVDRIDALNDTILELCDQFNVKSINLNSIVAPEKSLLHRFSSDDCHLSQEGFNMWAKLVLSTAKQL